MNRIARIAVASLVALMIAWLAGWIMGRSGKPELQTDLAASQLRLALTEARSSLLEARVDLYNVNFGNASRRFEEAKLSLRSASERLQRNGSDASAAELAAALQQADAGQALANKLDLTANARAAEALTAIDKVLGEGGVR